VRLQAKALEQQLANRGLSLPIYVGMRNWRPYLDDVFRSIVDDGIRRVIAVVLTPHEGSASTGRYTAAIEDCVKRLGDGSPAVEYLRSWYDNQGFVQAVVERIANACEHLDAERERQAAWIFTAHSIPERLAQDGPYTEQFARTAELVAFELGLSDYTLAYQSGAGEEGWLTPDVNDALKHAGSAGHTVAVVTPIGFLSDHVEVLYDLDIEAKQSANDAGMEFIRPKTVNDHPRFIAMLADLIKDAVAKGGSNKTYAA
jgi:ferrochelatase